MFGFLDKGATHEARINGKSIHVEADDTTSSRFASKRGNT